MQVINQRDKGEKNMDFPEKRNQKDHCRITGGVIVAGRRAPM
jgi:hypothetical protein